MTLLLKVVMDQNFLICPIFSAAVVTRAKAY